MAVDDKDLRWDVFRSGGQGYHPAKSAVRVTHVPTGIAVTCNHYTTQSENQAAARAVLELKVRWRQRQRLADLKDL